MMTAFLCRLYGSCPQVQAFARHISLQQQAKWRQLLSTTCRCPDNAIGGLPRFFVGELPSLQGSIVLVSGDEMWHMLQVLRLGLNDRVELFDGRGRIVEGLVVNVGRRCIDVITKENVRSLLPAGPHLHVAAAFGSLKGGRGDWLVEKCTELGARSVIPLLAERSLTVSEGRNDRWNRLVLAATKQYFTESEKKLLLDAGAVFVGLGPRRLRVETAAIAMLSAVMMISDPQLSNSRHG